MKFIKIWEKLGKQTIKNLDKEAYVYVNDEKYKIEGIRYENGIPIGFNVIGELWRDSETKPDVHEWVIVCDKDGKEYDLHQWNGFRWYAYVMDKNGDCDGYPSDVEIVRWKYDERFKRGEYYEN